MHAIVSNFSRASRWEWAQAALLSANGVWTTLCLGGYRPETKVVTSVLTSLLLVMHCAERAGKNPLPAILPASWWLLPFLFYAALNVWVISPVPWLGWLDWLGWANLLATFWVVVNGIRSAGPRRMLWYVLVLLGLVAVGMACYQRFARPEWLMLGRIQAEQFSGRASGPFGIPNSLAAFLLLLLPATGALTFRRRASAVERVWWGWVTVVFLLGIFLTLSRGAWVGLGLALMIWPIAMRRWPWKRRVGWAGGVLVAIAGVGIAIYWVSPKARERVAQLVRHSGELSRPILWRGAWNLFREHPVAGSGAGSYNVLFERYRPERFVDEPQWAHNDYLNTLSDYGAVGFGLFFGVAIAIAVRPFRLRGEDEEFKRDRLDSRTTRSALGIGVLAFAFQLFVDFHFKIPALAMAFATTAALAVGRQSNSSKATLPASRWRRLGGVAGVVVFFAGMIPIAQCYRAEAYRYRAREAIDAYNTRRSGHLPTLIEGAEADLHQATTLNPRNAAAWSDLAFTREMQIFVTPKQRGELALAEEQAARRALAISTVVPEFWIRLGVSLDLQRRFKEAGEAFQRSLTLAPKHSHGWYYYASHLARDTKQQEAALRAIATCLSLDPGNTAAEALRVKLTERP